MSGRGVGWGVWNGCWLGCLEVGYLADQDAIKLEIMKMANQDYFYSCGI